ncbi:MAG: nucleoside phosphorylase [Magnetospirillum sp. WYHS-4]
MTRLGVIVGMASEAACLPQGDALRVGVSGARPDKAYREALGLVDAGCTALVSFGVAGALDPVLKPGALLAADAVVLPGGRRVEADARWRKRLTAKLARGGLAALPGSLLGRDGPVILASRKKELRTETGALAVDMESHAVAAVAAEYGLSFLVLRAIADPAGRAIPSWVTDLVAADGTVDPWKAAYEALCRPWDIPSLVLLGRENALALKTLQEAVRLSGGRLGAD